MISFACKAIDFSDLIKCSFGLNKTEYSVLIYLVQNNLELSVADIADKLSLDRTTVQKSIKSLAEKELVFRTQQNMEKGGYVFLYSVKDKDAVRRRMLGIVQSWHSRVVQEINAW